MKMAIIEINGYMLANLLQLPDGARIVDASADIERQDTLLIKIEGAGWDTPIGDIITRVVGCVSPDGKINWGF